MSQGSESLRPPTPHIGPDAVAFYRSKLFGVSLEERLKHFKIMYEDFKGTNPLFFEAARLLNRRLYQRDSNSSGEGFHQSSDFMRGAVLRYIPEMTQAHMNKVPTQRITPDTLHNWLSTPGSKTSHPEFVEKFLELIHSGHDHIDIRRLRSLLPLIPMVDIATHSSNVTVFLMLEEPNLGNLLQEASIRIGRDADKVQFAEGVTFADSVLRTHRVRSILKSGELIPQV